jgi:cytochrome c-type biogenesis protein CcmH/NrfG
MAMTYVATSSPMQGIILLREVLESDPVNEQAMFNLGILSIQSRQYDKAIERLEKLVSIYPENLQAQFYLGVSYFESGEKQKAKKLFELVKVKDNDPALQATVNSYLEEIK